MHGALVRLGSHALDPIAPLTDQFSANRRIRPGPRHIPGPGHGPVPRPRARGQTHFLSLSLGLRLGLRLFLPPQLGRWPKRFRFRPLRPARAPELPLFPLLDQGEEGAVDHFLDIPGGNRMAQERLRVTQVLVGALPNHEPQKIPARSRFPLGSSSSKFTGRVGGRGANLPCGNLR